MKTGVGDVETETAKSASPAVSTRTEDVDASLDATGSGVVEVVSAELRITVPAATPPLTVTLIVNVAVAALAKAALSVQMICPVPPTAGVLHVHVPPGLTMEANVVLGGVC